MYSYRTVVHTNIKTLELFLDIKKIQEKILKTTIDFDICNLLSSGDLRNVGDIDTSWLLIYLTIL